MSDGWLPFQLALAPESTVERIMEVERCDREYAEMVLKRMKASRIFKNNLYQVSVFEYAAGGQQIVHLNIKRVDKRHIHDWRDLQRIKNELVGPENEAIELYPAESRVVDEANQYHLWVFKDPGFTLGFGNQGERMVADWDEAKKHGARQRPLPEWMKNEKK